jgi:hypothetical protein
MKRILSAAGGRGGGSNVLAQGSVPKITSELLQELTSPKF